MSNNDAENGLPSIEDVIAMVNAQQAQKDAEILRKVQTLFQSLDPIQSASVFCGLATIGSLQSNQIRISNLVHASLKFGAGTKNITKKQIRQLFRLLEGSSIERDEDPAEDVFVATACTKNGSYRIFEGNLEGSTFFLERFVDIVDEMPDSGRYKAAKKFVHGLLRISDIVASKAEVDENIVTAHVPESDIPPNASLPPELLRQRIKFTEEELHDYGIDIQDLSPFMFYVSIARDLPFPSHHSLTHLDKCPIIAEGNGDYFLYPQGVSSAIRSYLISAYTNTQEDRDALTISLVRSYSKMLQSYQLLGKLHPPPASAFSPSRCGDVLIQEFMIEVTKRRPLHLIFIFDGFHGNNLTDWVDAPLIANDEDIKLTERIENARKAISSKSSLKQGITLLVSAGWGRPKGLGINFQDTDEWCIRHIGIHDLCHLSDHPDMKPLHLWRMIKAEKWLELFNCTIVNINGMLNLFGWLIYNDWHIVPHEQLPQEDLPPSGIRLTIPTNFIADVRMAARRAKDRRMIQDIEGVPKSIIRYTGKPYFREDEFIPLYGCLDSLMKGELGGVYVGKAAIWWCRVNNPSHDGYDYGIWESAISWLQGIDQAVYEKELNILPVVEWQLCIENVEEEIPPQEQFSSNLKKQGIIETTIRTCPDGLFNKADNSGEVAMVKSYLVELLPESNDEVIEGLIKIIFPNKDAKRCHFLRARTYTDYIAANLPKPILIEKSDDANLRLGLGWLEKARGRFQIIKGTEACVKYLNGVVDKVWDAIANELKTYRKADICEKFLLNIEAVRRESTNWDRTIRACLALHEDKENVHDSASLAMSSLTAASLGSRLLIEMGVCTCPDEADDEPDELDISTLLGYALLIFHLGAWSDAIKCGLYPPTIHVSCFGQIMMDYELDKTIIQPYHAMLGRKQRETEAKRYDDLYDLHFDDKPVEEIFPPDYLSAWKREFYVDIDQLRDLLDSLENIGISSGVAIYTIHRSSLVDKLTESIEGLSKQDASLFISRISLPTRLSWDQLKGSLPPGMEPQDWYPWNFRRRLSLVSRPIVELDGSNNPLLLISPGSIREGIRYLLSNSFNATFDERHFYSEEMKKWIGACRNQLGKEFNRSVANKMIELGWEAESDVPVTKLLNAKTDKDYGDIDVLAWSRETGVVLAAECKDLYFSKTHKEIGNQINEFRGIVDSNGKRDRLRKHFDRLDKLKADIDKVRNYTRIVDLSHIYGLIVFNHRSVVESAPQIPRDRIHVCAFESLSSPDKLCSALVPWK